jgi:hypothetical protein
VLVIVDDVWSDAAAHAFRVTGAQGRLLYTSRDQRVIEAVRAAPHRVKVLSPEAARALAANVLHVPVSTLPAVADRVFDDVGRAPLAVALLAAAVRGGRSWDQVGADLDQDVDIYGEHPYADAFRAMQISAAVLPADLRTALFGLAVFPPDIVIPVAAILRYWAHTRRQTEEESLADLDRLAAANVVRRGDDAIGFHDLLHDFLVLHAPALEVLHADLLDAYRALLPAGEKDEWWRLPLDVPYVWEHVIAHMAGAGDRSILAATVIDPAYQTQRITGGGPHGAEEDLALAARYLPDDPLVAWWCSWLARDAHLFSAPSIAQDTTRRRWRIAGTLLSWLSADPRRPRQVRTERLAPLVSQPYLAVVAA